MTELAPGPLRLIGDLQGIERLEPLDGFRDEMVQVVGDLLGQGADPLDITASVAHANDALTRRLIDLAIARLGPPPCAFAWLALGSHGRGEQVLSSDQDSALAYADVELAVAGDYFSRLSTPVVAGLARSGLALCPGGYMATSWGRALRDYHGMFRAWVEQPEPGVLVHAEVFMDVRPVYGDLSVDVLTDSLTRGGSNARFLVQMARAAVSFRPPLGLLARLRGGHATMDVKTKGTAPIVLVARLYALAGGSGARSTAQRLAAAAASGVMSPSGASDLTGAYRLLTGMRLQAQVDQVRAGAPPDNIVRLARLSDSERRQLREAAHAIRDVQTLTAMRYATDTVS